MEIFLNFDFLFLEKKIIFCFPSYLRIHKFAGDIITTFFTNSRGSVKSNKEMMKNSSLVWNEKIREITPNKAFSIFPLQQYGGGRVASNSMWMEMFLSGNFLFYSKAIKNHFQLQHNPPPLLCHLQALLSNVARSPQKNKFGHKHTNNLKSSNPQNWKNAKFT